MIKYSWLFVLLLGSFSLQAQEFQCEVSVNAPKIQTADPRVFKNLETAIRELMNNRDWAPDIDLEAEERINLNIIITIDEELSATSFKAQMIIQAGRPVYNSGYNSVLFQHIDKNFIFEYGEFEVLDFAENSFTSNLTSMLAFYAYVTLGMDADSFSELGGDEYLNKAQDIVNTVPQNLRGQYRGWQASDGQQNRFWLIDNLLNVRVKPMRRAMYLYHLRGLDQLANESSRQEGIQSIKQALQMIRDVNNAFPASMIVQVFANAKRDEIIKVFEVADMRTKREVHGIMVKLDAPQASQYQDLLKP